jgi:hypothetical protein
MRLALRTAAPVALCLVLARLLVAQVDHAHNAEQLGRVVAFPTSRRPQVQAAFERALALSHSFWWEAGPPAFRAVAAADSECAMAYWGLALNRWGNPFTVGAERGLAIGARTARERGFGAIGP